MGKIKLTVVNDLELTKADRMFLVDWLLRNDKGFRIACGVEKEGERSDRGSNAAG